MASSSYMRAMGLLVVLFALRTSPAGGVIQCGDVVPKLIPCEPFVLDATSKPSDECCSNAQELDKLALTSIPDRKAICQCLTTLFKSLPVDHSRAKQIPQLCNLTTKITDPDIDCNTI